MHEDLRASLASIAAEWDKTEQLMKLAEKVRAEVVFPSVNELRYAGRRLVDAWAIAPEAEADQEKRKEFDAFVKDALFRCHCAQHDAIDATTLFVQTALDEYEREFGHGPIITHFPEIADLRLSLAEAGDLTVNSRRHRGKRAAEYDKLAADHLPTITLTYRKIQTNRSALEALVAEARAAKEAEDAKEKSSSRADSQRFRWGIIWPVIIAILTAAASAAGGYVIGKVRPPPIPSASSPQPSAPPPPKP